MADGLGEHEYFGFEGKDDHENALRFLLGLSTAMLLMRRIARRGLLAAARQPAGHTR